MKSLLILLLTWSAKRVLAKHKPTIIAVTGSVGKTSTKEAIAVVLGSAFNVRTNKKNLNTEIGVPLTILDLPKPSVTINWIGVAISALRLGCFPPKTYPTHLVLEFGADRPGDIRRLVDLAPPRVGVVTAITPVHAEFFPSLEALMDEKSEIIKRLPSDGLALLNADDERVVGMREKTSAPVVCYGSSAGADFVVENYQLETREDAHYAENETLCRLRFTVRDRRDAEEGTEVVLTNTVGMSQAIICAAAIAVGKQFGVAAEASAAILSERYAAVKGRMRPLHGIKGTLLLDDSYNAAPKSMAAALEVLKAFHPVVNARRVAALGEMAELGVHTEAEHRQLGWKAAEAGVDLLVLVGEKSRDTARGALEAGMKDEQIVLVKNSEEAGRYLDREIKQGDVVLVKGSQSSRMEKTVLQLLAEPTKAADLLVRQEPEWL